MNERYSDLIKYTENTDNSICKIVEYDSVKGKRFTTFNKQTGRIIFEKEFNHKKLEIISQKFFNQQEVGEVA
jgi:hypothetical protein